MTSEVLQMRTAFLEARSRLVIEVNPVPSESLTGLAEHLVCHVAHFGGLKGCIPVSLNAPASVVTAVQAAGYYCSQLSDSYLQFDADLFRDTLNDWGYFGPPALRPNWYAGYVHSAQA